ncbi:PREDICTED: vesicle-associated membrane protein 711-like [Hipposideros armiger]|uniref:Vesicle-associated membrane protein 7 n=1 Tax=Hipposideros armiger TaxID=186990 RepID=A0A8B7S7L7_HIPAR|nr:PREDICTED: vesicle-associated membrane protein 711-like [Hipposideros armiger]
MTITYSCIANGREVLADLALTGGSYQEPAATVLRLVLLRAERNTIIQMGSFIYHSLFIDGITYLCASDNALDTITPSAFLKSISDTFLRNPLMSQEHFSPSNAVAADFQQVLGKYMVKYNKNQDNSSMSTLRSQVADVKNFMTQNIDKLLETEERFNIFPDKTDALQTTAKDSKTRKILKRIWWKHFKKIIIISMAILLSIIIILLNEKTEAQVVTCPSPLD